ncbi:MAG: alpha/beta fold hydrolase [Planctomycetes bacterium]|nr:alpha/beta fold hydrolase [Planctomycetota bacterium]
MRETFRSSRLMLAFLALVAAPVLGQSTRFELGQRLRSFEATWSAQERTERRQLALPEVEGATRAFLSFRSKKAGERLDRAILALRYGKAIPALAVESQSITLSLSSRVLAPKTASLGLEVDRLYDVPSAEGARPLLRVWCAGHDAVVAEAPFQSAAQTLTIDPSAWSNGDHELLIRIVGADTTWLERRLSVSIIEDFAQRLAALEKAEPSQDDPALATTRAQLIDGLRAWSEGDSPEAACPAARWLTQAEALAKPDATLLGSIDTQDCVFALPIGSGSPTIVRLALPEGPAPEPGFPLVVLLHGMGGSENLFFEAHGSGLAVDLARQRNWVVVAPRQPLVGGAKPKELVEELARRLPIDPGRIFIIGHSMGASRTLAAAASDDIWRGIAAISVAFPARGREQLAQRPLMVVTGSHDFSRTTSRALKSALEALEPKHFEWLEIENTEHLTVVQESLPAIYKFFDRCLAE